MNVTFKSTIKGQGKEDQVIEFTEPVTISEFDGFNVYEFKEPSAGVQNRIEVSGVAVNIFAGAASINLELDTDVAIVYETPAGPIQLMSHMSKLDATTENPSWTYTLKSGEELIGEYSLSLKVK